MNGEESERVLPIHFFSPDSPEIIKMDHVSSLAQPRGHPIPGPKAARACVQDPPLPPAHLPALTALPGSWGTFWGSCLGRPIIFLEMMPKQATCP